MSTKRINKKKIFTLMIVPHNGRKIRSLEISIPFLITCGVLFCAMLFSALFFSYKHVTIQAKILQNNAYLISEKEKNEKISNSIQKISELNNKFTVELKKTSTILNNPQKNDVIHTNKKGDLSQALYMNISKQDDNSVKVLLTIAEMLNKNIPVLENVNKSLKAQTNLMKELPIYWPVPNSVISAEWGPNIHPVYGNWYIHKGLDFAAVVGTPVYSVAEGIVTETSYDNGHGLNIYISHKYGFKTHYSHLSVIKVVKGQKVKQGERLGNIGATGLVTGPHLHLEVYLGEDIIDPGPYMKLFHSQRYAQVLRNR